MLRAGLLAVPLVVLAVVWGLPSASAQDDSTTTSSTATTATTPTTAVTTSTTEPATTTTSRPRTTTTRRSTPSSTASTTTTTTVVTTTTTGGQDATSTTTLQRFLIPDDTVAPRAEPAESSGSGGLSTDTKLTLVVVGLLLVASVIGTLTWLYWRHTRPAPYLDALDVLSEVKDHGAAAATALATTRPTVSDAPTAVTPVVDAGPAVGNPPVEPVPGAPTSAVRILGPVDPDRAGTSGESGGSGDPAPGDPAPASSMPAGSTPADEPTGEPVPPATDPAVQPAEVQDPPQLVTLEDLFGPQEDERPLVSGLGDPTDLWSDGPASDPGLSPGRSGDR